MWISHHERQVKFVYGHQVVPSENGFQMVTLETLTDQLQTWYVDWLPGKAGQVQIWALGGAT